ncbi:DUF4355 domain-containing protein [Bacillus pseudomycoides]|uniref:DUF4355 domain-containing protein n=1 Tax=Bacillus pseudomycoides TaxID=64104 RepID=UPI000BFAA1DA|nr:DUF4355 domain-containing protein [Bacillus pseudomycoides]PGE00045.1 hypothetical protein COM50_07165 [Bacillus pseudomycoides]
MEITLEQVQEFISTNAEAKQTLQGQFLTPETVDGFLSSEDGKKFIQPKIDSHVSKGINAWKQNNLQREIDEAVAKLNPSATPEQKEIQELKMMFQKAEQEKQFALQRSTALGLASEKGLPASLIDRFVGSTDSETRELINTYELEWKNALQVATEKVLAGAGSQTTPPNPEASQQVSTGKKFADMTHAERTALYQSNPKVYAQKRAESGL